MQFCRPLDYKTACIFARAKNARAVKRTFWSECESEESCALHLLRKCEARVFRPKISRRHFVPEKLILRGKTDCFAV